MESHRRLTEAREALNSRPFCGMITPNPVHAPARASSRRRADSGGEAELEAENGRHLKTPRRSQRALDARRVTSTTVIHVTRNAKNRRRAVEPAPTAAARLPSMSPSSTDDEATVLEDLEHSALLRDVQEARAKLGHASQAAAIATRNCSRCNGDDIMSLREGGNSQCDCWPAQADENAARAEYDQCWFRHEAAVSNFNALFFDHRDIYRPCRADLGALPGGRHAGLNSDPVAHEQYCF